MSDFTFDPAMLSGRIHGARYERENVSENYVSVPPAFLLTDSKGGMWTFGPSYELHNGEHLFAVMRNDVDMGETAKRLECKNGQIRIFGRDGWKVWSRRRNTFI